MAEFYIRDPLSPGMCGDDVQIFQQGLRLSGFESVPDNGVFGPETSAAWKEIFITRRLEDFDSGRTPTPPSQREQEIFRERYPNNEDYERTMSAYSPGQFSSRKDYESFLRSEPSPVPADVSQESWYRDTVPYGAEFNRQAGLSQDWRQWVNNLNTPFEKTAIAPSGMQCDIPIADAGKSSVPRELADHPLYEALRAKVPAEVSDLRVSELTLHALKDGITSPDRLKDVLITDTHLFAQGTTPGFRGHIDLTNPPMPPNELRLAIGELSLTEAAVTPDMTQARNIART